MINEIFKPEKAVEYLDGSINTNILVENEDRSIRVMALDVHEKIGVHALNSNVCVYILEGEIEFTISGKIYDLRRNEMIIMPKNAPHSLISKDRSKMMLIRL